MKRIIFIMALFSLMTLMLAEDTYYLPAAATDNFLAPKVNSAAMSFGNSSGLAFLNSYDEDGFLEKHSLYLNFKESAYIHDYNFGRSSHTLASSLNLFRNFYLGCNYYWNNKYFSEGHYDLSTLYRPADYLSLAVLSYKVDEKDPGYRFAAALRPFAFNETWGSRLSVSADFNYRKTLNGYDFKKPILGLQTHILNGISLNGSYDLEDEAIGVNVSLGMKHLLSGSLSASNKDAKDNYATSGGAYIYASDKEIKSYFSSKTPKFYDYKMPDQVIEAQPVVKFGPFSVINTKGKTIRSLINEIEIMKKDPLIKGLVIQSGNFTTSFANFTEIKEAFLDFKSSGKKIVFYFDNISNINYAFAASIADKIYLHPLGEVDLKGISISSPYIKTLLDTFGIEFTNFRSHPYKTAGNMFTETEMTEAEREALDFVLTGLYDEIKEMIVSGRGEKLTKSIDEIIDEGPYMISQQAVENGLVDKLIYRDKLQEEIELEFSTKLQFNFFL